MASVRRSLLLGCGLAVLWLTAARAPAAAAVVQPAAVTVAGSLQSELGCPADWQPDCAASHLAFDADDQVWQASFALPAGDYEYKAALNNGWDENYGAHAERGGANIPLNLATDGTVKLYYSHATHWVTDNLDTPIAVAPGSFQSELGCPGDWQPDCLRSWLQDPDGDGVSTFTAILPAGSYETKVAIGESWNENYGAGGVANGPNIAFTVTDDCSPTVFSYDATTHVLAVTTGGGSTAEPNSVTVAGSLQSELGCSADWQPDCVNTHLTFDADDQVWQGTFNLPAGNYEYKAPINDSWDVNYGANAQPNGPNIPLSLAADGAVKFYYADATHWITSSANVPIATAAGSFQSALGCPGDWQPDCLRSWLQDPDGDGFYSFSTTALPAGNYEAKVTIGESWSENYGAGGARDGANIAFSVPASCGEITFTYDATTHVLTVGAAGGPRGNLARAQAYWVSADTIAWNPGTAVAADWTVALHYDEAGGLTLGQDGVAGGTSIPLSYDPAGLSADVRAQFPHLATLPAFHLPADRLAEVPVALLGELAVSAKDALGAPVDATSLQIQGVLDDLYAYDGALGATFDADHVPTLRLWAPTAREVNVQLYADGDPATTATAVAMTKDPHTGVWTATGDASWYGRYYVYEVAVFVRATGQVEHNWVTDPYSVSLSANSQRSQLISLDDPATAPSGWAELAKPPLRGFEDITLYELHVRDFSASDASVPVDLRGTFAAFAQPTSAGMTHLQALAAAGLTHVHLLPAFDFATVEEDKANWQAPAGDLASFPADSEEQQARVSAVADSDGFNWGYDPWHYTVPEGSYATDPDGPTRIVEFRQMVQGLAGAGLRTVMDVVYNHTTAAGQNARSVLDRIVPGYYHRLNADGNVETSTCCQNTASEFHMMEKLLLDSVETWAREYKVDGFRFDLMGHHMKRNLLALRARLDALTLAGDGVDGKKIFLYGEGWNFGEVANNARGEQATQANMAGTEIATFNDRLRDGARGGGPFSGIQLQGFLTGLWDDPNATDQGSSDAQLATLLRTEDWIRLGLIGNLADYTFEDYTGARVNGAEVDYNGQHAGYTADPQESINYVEAHDNETLFDTIALKAPADLPMAERVRMQNLGVSLLAFGQGVPFFHAGVELLRSKSLDRNSYNSGDWFNRVDWTGQSTAWGSGLPRATDNQSNWSLMQPLLADPALAPTAADIGAAEAHFREALTIRRDLRLLRLSTGAEVRQHVSLRNTGPAQVPGLLVLDVYDIWGDADHQHQRAVVFFNARATSVDYRLSALPCRDLALDRHQQSSTDPVVRTASVDGELCSFEIPGRTAAVFVATRSAEEQVYLLLGDVEALVASQELSTRDVPPLRSSLVNAMRQLRAGRPEPAATSLGRFIDRVGYLVAHGRLDGEVGARLIDDAGAVLAAID